MLIPLNIIQIGLCFDLFILYFGKPLIRLLNQSNLRIILFDKYITLVERVLL